MDATITFPWWITTAVALLFLAVGYMTHLVLTRLMVTSAEQSAKQLRENAKRDADVVLQEAKLQARDEVICAREAFEQECKTRRQELLALEERLTQRETNLDRKVALLDKKEDAIDKKLADIETAREQIEQRAQDLNALEGQHRDKLQEIAALSQDEARNMLMHQLEEELRAESGILIRHIQEDARARAEKEARGIITLAIERYAGDQVNEMTTSTVTLPSDDMKGRIIGREGRNIRSFEATSGVNILIDDTPEVVVISGFDPLRREIARIALERLIEDGRIHPARIEEVIEKVQTEVEETIRHAGEEAIYDLGLQGVAPELVRTLGRLKYRHSYGQNVLKHSIEMGHIMGSMASELGFDAAIAKRIGLFHDIGKALDHKVEGGHAIIGADLLKRNNESPVLVNAVAAHHRDVEPESLYAHLTIAADTITAARPGARSETTEIYLKRLEKLEAISNQFRGVEKSYAIQAGREIRVLVEPTKIDDNEAMQMARNISKQIEQELEYPGQIRVTVIRETRCVEYAK